MCWKILVWGNSDSEECSCRLWLPRVQHCGQVCTSWVRRLPILWPNLGAQHSIELEKQIYVGTRGWLDRNHCYRSEAMQYHFNEVTKDRDRPGVVTMEEQMQRAVEFQAWMSTRNRDGGPRDPSKQFGMKRLSILYRLPYWKVCQHHWVDIDSCSTSNCRTEPEMTETKETEDID